MSILKCIDKEATDWKQLVAQTNYPLALDTYATKGGMPKIIEESVIKDFIGFEEIIATKDNLNSKLKSIGSKLRLFNHNNNSSHSVTVASFDTQNVLQLRMNYLAIESEQVRQATKDRSDHSEYDFNKPVLGIFEKLDEQRNEFVDDIVSSIKQKINFGVSSAEEIAPMQLLLMKGGKDNKNGNLDTVEQTHAWGLQIKNYFDKLYKSKDFGSIIQLQDDPNIRGTILNINIPIKLIDSMQDLYGDQTQSGRKDSEEYYDELPLSEKIDRKKSEEIEVKSEAFINKNVIPQIEKFMASKFSSIGVDLEYYSKEDIETEFGKDYNALNAISLEQIILNKEKIKFDSPISSYAGHIILQDLKNTDEDTYNKIIELANQIPLKGIFARKFPLLDNESAGISVFSTLLNLDQRDQLNVEQQNYLNELQNILNNKTIEIKKGIPELFKENKNLALIGSENQYSEYLGSIFPNSDFKGIVYHGSRNLPFEKFNKEMSGSSSRSGLDKGIFFTDSKPLASSIKTTSGPGSIIIDRKYEFAVDQHIEYGMLSQEKLSDILGYKVFNINDNNKDSGKYSFKVIKDYLEYKGENINSIEFFEDIYKGNSLFSVILDIKKPKTIDFESEYIWDKKKLVELNEVINSSDNSVIFENVYDINKKDIKYLGNTYVVFEPEQIHILGSDNDEKSFKTFVENKSNINIIFNKVFGINLNVTLNSSNKDILLQLKDNKEFMSEVNEALDLNKEEIFSNISKKEILNKLEELNYIQQICKI